jgi:hypothetical protein
MTQATSPFRSQLREAVREARAAGQTPPPKSIRAAPNPAKPARRTIVRLWLPLTPLWVILSPFAILAAPLLLLAPQTRGVRPFRAVFAIGAALFALSGTVVDVETPDALVRIRIY